ncbi:MAG: amidohydrolase family protein [Geothrix sp.]|uniref:amidohydrolase family protein n=1 Tax=Geothrix sp. TaxID=1962974 RepID=UPI0017B9ADC7|nr:amidohydrolase family protein [Geothrix sp.]NWJ40729.1 amidohydrolase family protein [Geothrix sp.]WIL21265.1 MAG: amidohydrolase family protein [Geothrix sp.]
MSPCRRITVLAVVLAVRLGAQTVAAPSTEVRQFLKVDAPVVALVHARVVDGTGAPAREDQVLILRGGCIEAMGPAAALTPPKDAQVIDLTGHTVLPGLVGMHNHLFYTHSIHSDEKGAAVPPGRLFAEIAYSAPRLYLACGITTIRTTGSLEPYTDLNIKRQIDAGLMPGPKMDVTGPYLEGLEPMTPQMHALQSPEEARRFVDFWADAGVTSFKAYMNIRRADLGAAIQAAHARGLKVTGHLGSVTWPEAMALGIDDFEHGPVYTDTEFAPDKKPDVGPPVSASWGSWLKVDVGGPEVQKLIRDLVAKRVAVTSTLPVFELGVPGRPPLQARMLAAMSAESKASYLAARGRVKVVANGMAEQLLKKEMAFELAFVKAGGLLLAGPDPTGAGGVLPGFGDQRELELLVEAGFTPVEAIRIYSANGAAFLGRLDRIGTLAPGKQADLVVVKGDPSRNIADVENVVTVFKDGLGYDSARLIESVRGHVGIR